MIIEDAAAPFDKLAVQRLHTLDAANDEHPLAAQIERRTALVAVPAATGSTGISGRAGPLLETGPSLLEQRIDQFALALETLRQRCERLPEVLVFRFKFRPPDFPQRRGRLIHGVQFGFQAVAFIPERGIFLRANADQGPFFRLFHAAARNRFAFLQQPDAVGLLLVLAFQFGDKTPGARLFLRDTVHGHMNRAIDRAAGFIRKLARGRRPQKPHIRTNGKCLLPLREKVLFTQKPQRDGLAFVLPAEQLAHLPGQRVFRGGGVDEQLMHLKRREFDRRKRHFLQEMLLFGKRDPHTDKRAFKQLVRFPYAMNSP